MAYPPLSSYWLGKSRKDLAERTIVARREQEAQRFKQLNSDAQYYRDLEIQSSRYQSLENPRLSSSHWWKEEYSRQQNSKEEKKQKLQERRAKLAAFLKAENDKLKAEMELKQKESQMKDPWKLDALKQQVEDIRKRREEEHKKAYQKRETYLPWKRSLHLRQLDAKLLQQEVVRAWEEQQKAEDMKELRRLEEEEKQRTARLEQEKQETEKELMELDMKRKKEAEKNSSEIDQQREQVTNEIEKSKKLKADETKLLKQLAVIEVMKVKRSEDKQCRARKYLTIALMRLPKDKLRKKSFEIQQEIEFDRNILETLKAEIITDHTEEKMSKLQDIFLKGQKTIEDQVKAEKEKQNEIQVLYQEEAGRLSYRYEGFWEQQKTKRDEEMNKVLDEMKNHLKEQLAQNLKWQEESLTRRDHLLQSLEEICDRDKEKEEQCLAQKEKYEENIKSLESALTSRAPLSMPNKYVPWPWRR